MLSPYRTGSALRFRSFFRPTGASAAFFGGGQLTKGLPPHMASAGPALPVSSHADATTATSPLRRQLPNFIRAPFGSLAGPIRLRYIAEAVP